MEVHVGRILILATFALFFALLWALYWLLLPIASRLLAFLASRGARFHTYAPVVLIVIAGALLTAWAGEAFIDLGEDVQHKAPQLLQLDASVQQWAISARSPGATRFFVGVTDIGGPAGCATIAVIAAIVLAIQKRWRWIAYLAATTGGGALLNMELKRYFARARPDITTMLKLAKGYSFPSGHAMGSTVVFGALSYFAFRLLPGWRWKSAALAFATTMVIAVALSRVYLGAHWLSDVGAGIVAGSVWNTATTVAYETLRRVRLIRAARSAGPPPATPPTAP